jgi:hypothetical protein
MVNRYRAGLALTLALFLLIGTTAGAAGRARHRHHRVAQTRTAIAPAAADLYSRRALRRARIILQLKLLELRSERLERVRKVIERNLKDFDRPLLQHS